MRRCEEDGVTKMLRRPWKHDQRTLTHTTGSGGPTGGGRGGGTNQIAAKVQWGARLETDRSIVIAKPFWFESRDVA